MSSRTIIHDSAKRALDAGALPRRIGAVLLALVAAVALATQLNFSQKAVHDAVVSRIQSLTGLYVAPSEARLVLLPHPHIAMQGLAMADRKGSLRISAEAAYAALNPLALATGRIELSAIQLLRPNIRLDLDETVDAPGEISRAAAAAGASRKFDRLLLGVASIVDGHISIAAGGRAYVLDRADLTLDWRRLGEPLSLTGRFDWRREKFNALLWLARPGDFLRGGETVATAHVDGETLGFEARGPARLKPDFLFSGRLTASVASARRALDLLDIGDNLPVPFANAQLSAQAVISGRTARFDGLKLVADGHEFEGRANLERANGRIKASTTLRSPFLSAEAILIDSPGWLGADGQWSRESLDRLHRPGVDIDLRLETERARLLRLALDDAVVLVTLREGAFDVALTEARGYHGDLKLRATLAADSSGPRLHADARLHRVDAGALLRDLFGRSAIAGAVDATMSVDATGSDVSTWTQSATGRASVALDNGRIEGVDLDRALRRLDRRPLSSALDIHAGRTVLDRAAAEATIANGVAEIHDGHAQGPGVAILFSGRADLAERALLLSATARGVDGATNKSQIAFEIGGGWDDLRLSTDPQSLIRRSDAAAPLLFLPTQAEPIDTRQSR